MQIFRWITKILPFLTFLGIRKRYRRRISLMKIEVAKAYVLGVEKTRFFFLGALFIFFSLLLLASGLLLIHLALFVYSDWTIQVKFLMGILLGCLEVLIASGIMFYLFREKTWVKFSGINQLLNSVVKKEN